MSAFLTGAGTQYDKLEAIPQMLRDTAGFALRNNTSAVIDASDPNDPTMVGADRTEQALLLVFGALPPAVLNFMFAERYHQEPEKVASMVLIGNLASVLFLSLALALVLN